METKFYIFSEKHFESDCIIYFDDYLLGAYSIFIDINVGTLKSTIERVRLILLLIAFRLVKSN